MEQKIMIFILSYNHRKTIMKLLDRIPEETWSMVTEVLIADDESSDDTVEVAQKYKKEKNLKKLTIIKHKKNKGYGGNQKFCYNYAIEKNYDLAVMLHGDLQYPPEMILPLAKSMIEKKADMAFGSRMSGNPLKGGMPLYKYFGNIFLTTVENLILGTKLTEFHSGFRIYSVKSLSEIPFNKLSNDFHFDSEIIVLLVIVNKKIIETPIPTRYGDERCNVNSIQYGFNVLGVMGKYLMHKYRIKKEPMFENE